ncbi:methyltransferase [uncultured Oxalicibacterium sp.]|uniref:methyltransferase n=1 Tax=uncultured Oxalicibacterium sp. TaxID=1168540 RepID=UPI0025EDE92C|nr:methyltransferase [uncultured Oxalicibacterium sp.]
MSLHHVDWEASSGVLAYLCVDAFLRDMVGARALATAFETGLIDHLQEYGDVVWDDAIHNLGLDGRGSRLLLQMLRAHGVLDAGQDSGRICLSGAFVEALRFRDILEAKLYFANLVAPDFTQLATALLMQPDVFFTHARLFKLFSYQYAETSTPENREQTARWMRITTALTHYEAAACLQAFDFSGYRNMLDVGGNSGEFVLQICEAHPTLQASVIDLPVVCDIGMQHVADHARGDAATRIRFVKHRREQPALPRGHDLISFKSMLHDWPEEPMVGFLQRAYDALPAGGTLMIFERCDSDIGAQQIGYGQLPLMMFFRSYRQPDVYAMHLARIGFRDIEMATVPLDIPFLLMTARKWE